MIRMTNRGIEELRADQMHMRSRLERVYSMVKHLVVQQQKQPQPAAIKPVNTLIQTLTIFIINLFFVVCSHHQLN